MSSRPRDGASIAGAEGKLSRPLGLPDDAFAQKRPHKGLITKSEVRAVSLYSLRLKRDSVVWDIGAGTGSVALEAAWIASQGRVFAVERDEEGLSLLRQNVHDFSADNIEVVSGEAPHALEPLPDPDSVFIGGTGGRLKEIVVAVSGRLAAGGVVVANFAAVERANEAHLLMKELGLQTDMTMVSASRGKALPDGSTRLEAMNPVFIITGQKEFGA
ncbi:MAG: precorrin-6Y C5,15-methyltransferase (decarboxylating) subunit CbiT [Chloroflexi bacterium]|nr:precorrin-6Y C5,15-methyltransferase (decarboxylating) subunit CbiT [Chloroflexota bacterium]MDA1228096.1 precorrin-6Y C5,15-methyltransferase (decarboxylating) subunit CbiT [Chloroflexota bacterium]